MVRERGKRDEELSGGERTEESFNVDSVQCSGSDPAKEGESVFNTLLLRGWIGDGDPSAAWNRECMASEVERHCEGYRAGASAGDGVEGESLGKREREEREN